MLQISYSKESVKIPNGIEENGAAQEVNDSGEQASVQRKLSGFSPTINPRSPTKRPNIRDFHIVKSLGQGAYAKVCLAKYVETTKKVAIKILDKKFMNKLHKSHEALIEKEILSNCNHPNIIKLISTFTDKDKLYFVLEYAPNRDLAGLLRTQGVLSPDLAKFYTAEIVSAIEYLHSKNIAHRDLKPENMVLDHNMHIKLVDFSTATMRGMYFNRKEMKFQYLPRIENGACEIIEEDNSNGSEELEEDLVGTAEYASPEMLNNSVTNVLSTDIWALGCIIYKFFHGKTPFHASNEVLIFDNIKSMKFEISKDLPEVVQDLIKRVLVENPEKRLGAGEKGGDYDFQSLKSHEFFWGTDFDSLNTTTPPIKITFLSKSASELSYKSNISHISEFNISLNRFDSLEGELSPVNEAKHNSDTLFKNQIYIPEYSFESFADLQDDHIIEDYLIKLDDLTKSHMLSPFNKSKEVVLLKEGFVKIVAFYLVYTTRKLKLFSNKKLELWDCERNCLMSIINIDSKCKVSIPEKDTFDIFDRSNNKYRFKTNEKEEAKRWVSKLNEIIRFN